MDSSAIHLHDSGPRKETMRLRVPRDTKSPHARTERMSVPMPPPLTRAWRNPSYARDSLG